MEDVLFWIVLKCNHQPQWKWPHAYIARLGRGSLASFLSGGAPLRSRKLWKHIQQIVNKIIMCKHSYFRCWLSYYQCSSREKWTINGHYYILCYHGNVWHQKNLILTRPHEFRWCILDGQTNLSLTATVTFDSSSIFLALQNSQFLTIFNMHVGTLVYVAMDMVVQIWEARTLIKGTVVP